MPIMDIHSASDMSGGSISPGLPRTCYSCQQPICSKFYCCVGDISFHAECLRCNYCEVPLEQDTSCFFRSGLLYCRDDYYRMVSARTCFRCNITIQPTEMVMRCRGCVFHTHCFTCSWCGRTLASGDRIGWRNDLIYCQAHLEVMRPGNEMGTPLPLGVAPEFDDYHETPISPQQYSPNNSPPQQQQAPAKKGRPRKRKIEADHELQSMQVSGQMDCQISPGSGNLSPLSNLGDKLQISGQQRTKRMRTSFKHHQLRTMKQYFSMNQNPDAKDLKQLAQKTNLSKRVLQVWFQNARAKWRRNNLRNHDPVAPMVTDSPSPVSSSNPLDFAQQQALEVTVETTFQELY